jgi:hypothetical protein
VRDQVSHPYKTTGKIIVFCTFWLPINNHINMAEMQTSQVWVTLTRLLESRNYMW